jgi:hypothetical protein
LFKLAFIGSKKSGKSRYLRQNDPEPLLSYAPSGVALGDVDLSQEKDLQSDTANVKLAPIIKQSDEQ